MLRLGVVAKAERPFPFIFQDIGVPTIFLMVPKKFPKFSMLSRRFCNEVLNLFP